MQRLQKPIESRGFFLKFYRLLIVNSVRLTVRFSRWNPTSGKKTRKLTRRRCLLMMYRIFVTKTTTNWFKILSQYRTLVAALKIFMNYNFLRKLKSFCLKKWNCKFIFLTFKGSQIFQVFWHWASAKFGHLYMTPTQTWWLHMHMIFFFRVTRRSSPFCASRSSLLERYVSRWKT